MSFNVGGVFELNCTNQKLLTSSATSLLGVRRSAEAFGRKFTTLVVVMSFNDFPARAVQRLTESSGSQKSVDRALNGLSNDVQFD
jgi:hypothetical protein